MPESGSLRLKLRDPDGQEREVSFTQDVVTIGRSHDCDLPLESGFISRNHARLSYMGTGWQIVDEGSKNGVFVNGQRIAGSTAVKPGDALRIGDYRVAVLPVESDTPASVEEGDSDRTLVLSPAMLEDLDPSAGKPAATSENAASNPAIIRQEQPPEPQPRQPAPAASEQAAEQPATPPYGIAAAEPAVPPSVAAKSAAATPPMDVEVGEEAAPALAQTPEAVAGETAVDADVPREPPESAVTSGAERLVVDAAQRRVQLDGRDLTGQLTSREIDVLSALSAAGANGCGIDELTNAVWGSGGGDAEMLERLLYRLRGKVDADLIERLPGRGLRLRAAG